MALMSSFLVFKGGEVFMALMSSFLQGGEVFMAPNEVFMAPTCREGRSSWL